MTRRRPDPFAEIRVTGLRTLRGINYWSRHPVTRVDVRIGAYDAISSADVDGFTEALVRALPGLAEHRCSIGERGGFVVRLRRGTYTAHIVEHVALELQAMIGHRVGYGRTRGAGAPGAYTLVFGHEHEGVGRRAAIRAVDIVRDAFAGTLGSIDDYVDELARIARQPPPVVVARRVMCGITGGDATTRRAARDMLLRSVPNVGDDGLAAVDDLAPVLLLAQGLPYQHARAAIVLDLDVEGVPAPYRDRESAVRLVTTLADALDPDGVVVCRAEDREVQAYALERGRRAAAFCADGRGAHRELPNVELLAFENDRRVWIEERGVAHDAGAVLGDAPIEAQLVVALALHALDAKKIEARLDARSSASGTAVSPESQLDAARSQSR